MCGQTGPVLSGLITLTMRSLSSVYSCHQSLGQGIIEYFRSELWYPSHFLSKGVWWEDSHYIQMTRVMLDHVYARMTLGWHEASGWLMSCWLSMARNLERWDAEGSEDAAREGQRQVRMLVLWWFCDNRSQIVTIRDTPSLSPQQLARTEAAPFMAPAPEYRDHFSQYTGHFLFVSQMN